MKKYLIIFGILLFQFSSFGQDAVKKDSLWKVGVESALSFSQVSLSNWAAGGENSVAANGFINLFSNYKKDNKIWENKLEVAFGLQKQGDFSLRKSNDKLEFSSTYGQKAFKNTYLTTTLNFRSQFADGYKYPNDSVIISSFLAPAYILLTVNLDYKPNDFFTLGFSPFSGRVTIVGDKFLSDQGAYGVTKGKKARYEFGGTVNMNYKKEIIKNVEIKTNLILFSNYLDAPQNIDVNWEVHIDMKINEFLSAKISTNLIYDDDVKITDKNGNVGPRTQFKEMFGVGFAYKFHRYH